MSLVKRAACDALAQFIQTQIPELAGSVFALWSDEEAEAVYPSVALVPGKLVLNPWQEDEVDDTDPEVLVLEVGDFEGDVELRVYAKSAPERERIGQLVQDLWFQREGAPGVLVTQTAPVPLNVSGTQTATIAPALAAFTIDDETWQEERVFSKKRFDFMTVGLQLPCLVARAVPTITSVQVTLAVENDLTQPYSSADDDGTIIYTSP